MTATRGPADWLRVGWWFAAAGLAAALAWHTWQMLVPAGASAAREGLPAPASPARLVPPLDYSSAYGLPVQHRRVKPLVVAASEAVRHITGRERWQGCDPVGLALVWLASGGEPIAPERVEWEAQPFLLCDYLPLHDAILAEQPAEAASLRQGWRLAPRLLRGSPVFARLVRGAAEKRRDHVDRAHWSMSQLEIKAEELVRRLALFDALCGRAVTPLDRGAVAGQRYFEQSPTALEWDESLDVWGWARLDRVPGSRWFSAYEMQRLAEEDEQEAERRWHDLLARRAARDPGAYLAPEGVRAWIANRDEGPTAIAAAWRGLEAQGFELDGGGTRQAYPRAAVHSLAEWLGPELRAALDGDGSGRFQAWVLGLRARLRDVGDAALIDGCAERLPPGSPRDQLLAAAERYRADDTQRAALENSLAAAARLLGLPTVELHPFPGPPALDWELALFHWRPFLWGWIAMLAAAALLGVSLAGEAAAVGTWAYRLGMAAMGVSLVWQLVGLGLRTLVADRVPVANLYETVVFAALGVTLLALGLEAYYRGRVIPFAGALAVTLGLMMADLLPLALDPSIEPLVPVLRSNFWLLVHVLTIVAGYAAGTLAWVLGNMTLGMSAWGRLDRADTKTLALYTYRAMQAAVLLLAVGTVLGGCWARVAWGRFWGWDPKEVSTLVAIICYVLPLHARYLGWVSDRGLAWAAVLCFGAVVYGWYVVNFVLAAGLHSYGFSTGGSGWVVWGALLNLMYLAVVAATQANDERQPDDTPPAGKVSEAASSATSPR